MSTATVLRVYKLQKRLCIKQWESIIAKIFMRNGIYLYRPAANDTWRKSVELQVSNEILLSLRLPLVEAVFLKAAIFYLIIIYKLYILALVSYFIYLSRNGHTGMEVLSYFVRLSQATISLLHFHDE